MLRGSVQFHLRFSSRLRFVVNIYNHHFSHFHYCFCKRDQTPVAHDSCIVTVYIEIVLIYPFWREACTLCVCLHFYILFLHSIFVFLQSWLCVCVCARVFKVWRFESVKVWKFESLKKPKFFKNNFRSRSSLRNITGDIIFY